MTLNGHILPEDLALYAMQLVDSEDRADLSGHLSECAECREVLASITGDLAAMALTADMHSPPAMARERLMKQVAREKKVVPMRTTPVPAPVAVSDADDELNSYIRKDEAGVRKKRGVVVSIAPWLGWVAAAAMLLISLTENHRRHVMQDALNRENGQMVRLAAQADRAQQVLDLLNDHSATRVSLTKRGVPPAAIGRATYSPRRGALVFMASNMDALPPYKTYELWVIPANGRDPIPAGTFQPDARGNAMVVMPNIPKDVEAKAFGITIEDQGGSQTPTLPIVMSGS